MKKVLMVITQPHFGGGVQRRVFYLIRLLSDQFKIVLTCPRENPLAEKVADKLWDFLPLPWKNQFDVKSIYGLLKYLRTADIDILHTHGELHGDRNEQKWASLLSSGNRLVHTIHGFSTLPGLTKAISWKGKIDRLLGIIQGQFLRSQVDYYISDAEWAVEYIVQRKWVDRRVIRAIPNGVPLDSFQNLKEKALMLNELGIDQSKKTIGVVGRLHRQKGLRYLIDAVADIKKKDSINVSLLLVGDGPLKKQLEDRAQRLGIKADVHFLGYREDVYDILNAVDIFVLPSLWEGLPYTLLEAMTLGKPVVATNIPGNAEALNQGECGLLVNPMNVTELRNAIKKLLYDRALSTEIGGKARLRVHQKYRVEAMAKEVAEVYNQIADL